jgi:hypothetical protein
LSEPADLEQRVRDQAARLLGAKLELGELPDGTWRAALTGGEGSADLQATSAPTREEALQDLAFVLDLGV